MRKILFLLLLAFPCTSRIAAQDIHFIGKRSVDTCHAKANSKNPILWKLKTNLLYDAFVVPNISAEMHLGRNWSAGLGYWYTWWKTNPCHRYWRSYGGEIDIRKYFGSQALKSHLTGHHLGAVSQMGMYDVEFGKRGNMSDFSYTIGAEYGYTFPISPRVSLDLGMALGYFGGTYKVYDPIDTHYVWQETRNRRYFGPVKADITLAHLVARGELAILALYPDESLTSWNKNKGIYPYNWIVARYARDIDRERYNIPAIPSTYLLDKNKKVIYKDAIIEAVESYLRHKYKL